MAELLAPALPGGGGGWRRWAPLPLCLGAVLMAWDAAPTLAERFESARRSLREAFPRARLGGTYQGLAKALCRTGPHRAVAAPLRGATLARSGRHALREGWCAFAADGSRFDCPRTAANKRAFGRGGRRGSGPQMYLTALWHMGSGLPFAWEAGRASAGERTHLRRVLKLLPPGALLVMDAGFAGHELLSKVVGSGRHFLLRVGSNASLLTGLGRVRREGPDTVYLWPKRRPRVAPLALRLIRVRVPNRPAVWLPTDVADRRRTGAGRAARLYAMRWGVEVFFRSPKQKLGRRKLCGASPARARVELHRAVPGLWAAGLLAVGAVVKRGRDPLGWSAAAVLRLLRGAARRGRGRGRSARALRAGLAGAVKDRYRRRGSKRAHRWPHKKRDKPPGDPRLRPATPREVLLAQELHDAKRAA